MAKDILLIDDDTDELEVFTEALRLIDTSYTCAQATSLDEAFNYLGNTTPTYIFLDFNMPKTNGLQCLSILKESGKTEESRIVLYSNFITDLMKKQVIQLGAYNYIQKPNTIVDLSEKLKDLLKD